MTQSNSEKRPQREPKVSEAPVSLDYKGIALSELLPEVLSGFDVEIGAAVDEVVVTARADDICASIAPAKRTHPGSSNSTWWNWCRIVRR